jgi:hypothetical protein
MNMSINVIKELAEFLEVKQEFDNPDTSLKQAINDMVMTTRSIKLAIRDNDGKETGLNDEELAFGVAAASLSVAIRELMDTLSTSRK